jgi:tetratricopeptide (TPR) repeat protein
MGLLDWLTGKRGGGKKSGERPRPKVVMGQDENSLMVGVDLGNGAVMIMDRDAYDYQYGESNLPAPAQRDLDALLPRVSRVRVLSGGLYRGEAVPSAVLLATSEPGAIAALRGCFAIVEDPRTFGHCGCLGGPTLELFAGAERVATIGLQHGHAIRWGRWKHDAQLRDGGLLNAWLTGHGVEAELLEVLYQNPFPFTGGRMEGADPGPLSRAEQRLLLAEIHLQRGDVDGALAIIDAVLADDPELGPAYAARGAIRHQQGAFDACVADLTAAIDRGVRKADVYFSRAVALDNLGLSLDAVADCTAALALDPRHANAYNSRGLVRMQLGQLDAARDDLEAAIGLAPDWVLPYLNRGQLAHIRADYEAAVTDYTRVIDQLQAKPNPDEQPMLAHVLWNRGQAHRSLGDLPRAREDRREALRLNPALARA